MRLIDGDALEKFLSDAEMEATKRKKYVFASALNVIQGNVRNFPTIKPERPKGEWTATYSDCGGDVWVSWKCSNCGYVRKKGWEYTNDGKKPDALFCEICNADMRGEAK